MAGDISLSERAIVLDESRAIGAEQTASAVQAMPGAVAHQYGPRVVIAAVPPAEAEAVDRAAPAGAVRDEATSISPGVKAQLDDVGVLGLEALGLRQSPEYASAKAQRPLAGEQWDSGAALAPDHTDEATEDASAPGARAGAPTSARLMGRVAVGVIMVEGPTADLQFTTAERTKVVAEIQNGLGWLGSQSSPAGVTWVYDIKVVRLTVAPGASTLSFEEKERRWRDPAMAQLGFGAGMTGVRAYVESIRSSLRTDWAYCAFFTKYPVGHFAYASIGGPRMVMHYGNDGWGPDNIDRVFAHETGHIFGAPDEYKSSGCDCGGEWGWFKRPNQNCESCATGGGVACIMRSNSWEMCAWTPYHLGFPQGRRYTGVFRAGSGAHGLWLNADFNSFVAKWKEWSAQGLRLEDLEITVAGGDVRYSGAFLAGNDAYGLWLNADWNSFVGKWKEWSGQGLRLVDLEIAEIGGQLRYSGVFRAGAGAYGLWVNADWNSFVAKWKEWSGQGLRLIDFESTTVNGQPRYSGAFVAGSDSYGLWVNADWNSFVAKWKEWAGQSLRLVDLEISQVNGAPRYSGVFRSGTDGYGLWSSDWTSFRSTWEKWSSQGLRLINVKNTPTGIEPAFAPVGSEGYAEGPVEAPVAAPVLVAAMSADEEDQAGFGGFAPAEATVPAEDDSGAGYGGASLDERPRLITADDSGGGYGAAVVATAGGDASASSTGYGAMSSGEEAPVLPTVDGRRLVGPGPSVQ